MPDHSEDTTRCKTFYKSNKKTSKTLIRKQKIKRKKYYFLF